jgi:hypothetical protein
MYHSLLHRKVQALQHCCIPQASFTYFGIYRHQTGKSTRLKMYARSVAYLTTYDLRLPYVAFVPVQILLEQCFNFISILATGTHCSATSYEACEWCVRMLCWFRRVLSSAWSNTYQDSTRYAPPPANVEIVCCEATTRDSIHFCY